MTNSTSNELAERCAKEINRLAYEEGDLLADGVLAKIILRTLDLDALVKCRQEAIRLRREIEITLRENAGLADGENCTLIRLKRAIEKEGE